MTCHVVVVTQLFKKLLKANVFTSPIIIVIVVIMITFNMSSVSQSIDFTITTVFPAWDNLILSPYFSFLGGRTHKFRELLGKRRENEALTDFLRITMRWALYTGTWTLSKFVGGPDLNQVRRIRM